MISIEEEKALETFASMVTMAPWGIGFLKATLFIVEVTTWRLQCRCAAIAQQRSIQLNNWPPKRLFSVFVSLGNTICVMTARLSLGVLNSSIMYVVDSAKVAPQD
jgi:hypothetical protein